METEERGVKIVIIFTTVKVQIVSVRTVSFFLMGTFGKR